MNFSSVALVRSPCHLFRRAEVKATAGLRRACQGSGRQIASGVRRKGVRDNVGVAASSRVGGWCERRRRPSPGLDQGFRNTAHRGIAARAATDKALDRALLAAVRTPFVAQRRPRRREIAAPRLVYAEHTSAERPGTPMKPGDERGPLAGRQGAHSSCTNSDQGMPGSLPSAISARRRSNSATISSSVISSPSSESVSNKRSTSKAPPLRAARGRHQRWLASAGSSGVSFLIRPLIGAASTRHCTDLVPAAGSPKVSAAVLRAHDMVCDCGGAFLECTAEVR